MEIKKVTALYFSPTGGTQDAARRIAEGISGGDFGDMDVTTAADGGAFAPGDLVVAAAPVIGGRVPSPVAERLSHIDGGGAFAVAAAVYGNRAWEDALLELKTMLESRGFRVVAAGAFIARHSIFPEFGAGRPDASDAEKTAAFASAVRAKISAAPSPDALPDVAVPGNTPYRKFDGVPMKPSVSRVKCGRCGRCAALCPAGAISRTDPTRTDAKKCITCMRCVQECPHYARSLNPLLLAGARAALKKACGTRREPETFI